MKIHENKHGSPGHFVERSKEYRSNVPWIVLTFIILAIIILKGSIITSTGG